MVSSNPPSPNDKWNGGQPSGALSAVPQDPRLDYEQARENCHASAVAEENKVDLYIKLGAIAAEAGRLEEAADALKAALAMDGRCWEAYGSLAMIHHQRQEYPQAVEMYLKCLELNGDNLIALLGLFQTCCKMGTFAIIIRYLEVYLGEHPRDVAVGFCLATLYARDGKLQKARAALQVILDLEPGKPEASHLLKQVEAALARGEPGQTSQA
jgi:tetratricopeptide (TPR) repeat protein